MLHTCLERFERSVLFRLTRFMAMAAIFVLLIIIAVGAVMIVTYFHSTDPLVAPNEVVSTLKQPISDANSDGPPKNGSVLEETIGREKPLKLPFVLQKYVNNPQNLDILKGWLEGLSNNEKDQFLNQMAQTVAAAENAHVDCIEAINKFSQLKLERLRANKDASEQRNIYIVWYTCTTISALILIALLSLILVMLAVERNTRRITSQ